MVFSELDMSVSRLESVNPEIDVSVEGKNVFVFSFSFFDKVHIQFAKFESGKPKVIKEDQICKFYSRYLRFVLLRRTQHSGILTPCRLLSRC